MSKLFRQAFSQVNWKCILARETCNGFRQAGASSLPGPAGRSSVARPSRRLSLDLASVQQCKPKVGGVCAVQRLV